MLAEVAHQTRAERYVAAGRLVLAVCSFFALWVDPSDPARWSSTTYELLGGYVLYASALVALAWRAPRPLLQLRLATHVLDLAVFTAFVSLTGGPASPFFVYYLFSLLGATLRFGSKATIATAAVVIAALGGMAGLWSHIFRDPAFELNRFLIRSAYLVVAASLLVHLAAYQERLRHELTRLASWPRAAREDPAATIEEALANAVAILGVPRALLVWEDEEEPWLELALLTPSGFRMSREVPGGYEPLVAPELSDVSFLHHGSRGTLVAALPDGTEVRPSGPPIHPALASRFEMDAVLSPRLDAQRVRARLFALDRADLGADDLLLGEVVAGLVGSRLDQLSLAAELKETAATAERVRLARDLHDGILQDLTGFALQLEALRPLLRETPEARERLDDLERVIETEQRDVRSVIAQLRPVSSSRHEFDLAASLEELRSTFAATWGLTLEVSGGGMETVAPPRIRYELFRIVREAVANAARHAGATCVRVTFATDGSAVEVTAADDGHGFPFAGRYDLAELNRMRLGPVTLKERIGALGGSLVVDSSPSGSILEIRLPLDRPR